MAAPCVKGCRCACNQPLCGCHDVERLDARIKSTEAELASLKKKKENHRA